MTHTPAPQQDAPWHQTHRYPLPTLLQWKTPQINPLPPSPGPPTLHTAPVCATARPLLGQATEILHMKTTLRINPPLQLWPAVPPPQQPHGPMANESHMHSLSQIQNQGPIAFTLPISTTDYTMENSTSPNQIRKKRSKKCLNR